MREKKKNLKSNFFSILTDHVQPVEFVSEAVWRQSKLHRLPESEMIIMIMMMIEMIMKIMMILLLRNNLNCIAIVMKLQFGVMVNRLCLNLGQC